MKKTNYILNNFIFGIDRRRRFNVGVYRRHWFNVGLSIPFFRAHHNKKFHANIHALYNALGRKSPLKPFEEKPLKVLQDLRDKETIKIFFKEFLNKGGVYKFTLKSKPNLYYIGSTNNLHKRFLQHTSLYYICTKNDNFHFLACNIDWDKFDFAVLDVSNNIKTIREKENFFLKKYYPLLNSRFNSSITIFKNQTTKPLQSDAAAPKDKE